VLSHGFIKGITNPKSVISVKKKSEEFLKHNFDNYFSHIDEEITEIKDLLTKKFHSNLEILLKTRKYKICNVEMHVLRKGSSPIPPHQDNFYHCTEFDKSLKILIPLQKFNKENGALMYLDCEADFPILRHFPSEIKNFSSFIKKGDLKKNHLKWSLYDYEIGDGSYHFLNNVHFSNGNLTSKKSVFLVYRFETLDAKINIEANNLYLKCREEHEKKLNKK